MSIYVLIYTYICIYIYLYIYIYTLLPPEDPPGPLTTHKINIFELPLAVPGSLETHYEALCQILTFGNALSGPQDMAMLPDLPDLDLQSFEMI